MLRPDPVDRARMLGWLEAGLTAVDPQRLVEESLSTRTEDDFFVIAIGKAAAAMTRGAALAGNLTGGIVVSDHREPVPTNVELLIGDHPIPGSASVAAARAVLAAAADIPAGSTVIALISGGGSSLCELPKPGVSLSYLAQVNESLMAHAATIDEINTVRCHLSSFKAGGVSRVAGMPIDTYVIGDVAGSDPAVVSSGPTVPRPHEPERALSLMSRFGIVVPEPVRESMLAPSPPQAMPHITLLADGHDAAQGVVAAAGMDAAIRSEWLAGPVEDCVSWMLGLPDKPLTVAVGEPVVELTGHGRGGRNTHAALMVARRIAGTDATFAAFATDGVDGVSGSAGGLVDGGTVDRGGDPGPALLACNSASYLEKTSDLLICLPTGTNVADLWILWRQRQVSP